MQGDGEEPPSGLQVKQCAGEDDGQLHPGHGEGGLQAVDQNELQAQRHQAVLLQGQHHLLPEVVEEPLAVCRVPAAPHQHQLQPGWAADGAQGVPGPLHQLHLCVGHPYKTTKWKTPNSDFKLAKNCSTSREAFN